MIMPLDPTDTRPISVQISTAIRGKIISGEWPRGFRIPTAKEIGIELHVNQNTALRALRILREEGLIEFGRGRPATVGDRAKIESLITMGQIRVSIDAAIQAGFSRDNVVRLVDHAFAESIRSELG
jgi:GntR family transcriptional regulator